MQLNRFIWIVTVCLLTSFGISVAQDMCPQIVEDALDALGDNCEGLDRNTACYGYTDVLAEFSEDVEPEFFTIPSDVTDIDILDLLQPQPMSVPDETWGIALMNLQANIPNSIPGQAVKFLLLGDTTVEGDIRPEEAVEPPPDLINVTATGTFNVFNLSELNGRVYDTVNAGDTLSLDALSPDAQFYRVVGDDYVGWITSEAIEADDRLAELPIIDGDERGYMQSFYLRSGIGAPQCDEAPQDSVIIQSPDKVAVEFTVNGAKVRLGSTVQARILPDGDTLEFYVIDGDFVILGTDGNDLHIPEGHRAFACLGEPINDGRDDRENDRPIECDWSEPETVPPAPQLCALENIPANILNYPLDLNCETVDPTPTAVPAVSNPPVNNPPAIPTATSEPIVDSASPPNNIDDNNLCYEGNAWGDGRCRTDYDWQAGFYYGQVEAGVINIEDIPAPFYVTPTPIPTVSPNGGSGNPIVASVSCGTSHIYIISVTAGPATDTTFQVEWTNSDAGTTQLSSTALIGGSVSFSVIPPDFPDDVEVITLPSLRKRRLGDLNCP